MSRLAALSAMLMGLLGVGLWFVCEDLDSTQAGEGRRLGRLQRRKPGSTGGMQLIPNPAKHGSRVASPIPDEVISSFHAETSRTLSGLVVTETNAPVKDCKITVRGIGTGTNKTVATGENGRFDVPETAFGSYDIIAAHPQFVTMIRPGYTIRVGDRPDDLRFTLPLGATIKGKVVDEEEKPLKDVQVLAHRRQREQMADGHTYLDNTSYKHQRSAADGAFAVQGVAMGENLFEFSRKGFGSEVRKLNVTAEKAGEEMKVVLKKSGKIGGVVMDDGQRPVGTATVYLTRYKPFGGAYESLQREKFTVMSDAKGRFAFSKLYTEGYYDLSIEHPDFAPGVFPLVSAGSEKLICTLEPGGTIEGRVEYIDRVTTPASVIVAARAVVKGTTFTKEVKSDGTGRFALRRLPVGVYKLWADSIDIVSEPKDGVACGRDKPVRDVVLEVYEACTARGRVSDAETDTPIGGAKVAIQTTFGVGRNRSKSFEIRTDVHGHFEFRKLPSGLHTASASADGYLRHGRGGAVQVFALELGEKKHDLALRLDPGGVVDGFVLDPEGRGAGSGAEVQLYLGGPGPNPETAKNWRSRTDSVGYFRISGIEVADRVLLYASARKTGFAKSRSDIIVLDARKPSATTQINLVRGGTVSGKVSDARGLPIARAEITLSSGGFPGDPSPSVQKVYTGLDGAYTVRNCPPGGASVTAQRSGFIAQTRGLGIADARHDDNVDFKLDSGLRIEGRVASLDGYPVSNAKVKAHPLDGAQGSDEAITDRNGNYTLNNLGRGAFRIVASFNIKTQDGDQAYSFVLPRVQSGTISAHIDCDVDNSASGIVVNDEGGFPKVFTISLRSRTDTKPPQDFSFNLDRAFTNTRGLLRLLSVPRGIYSLTVTADGYEPHRIDSLALGPLQRTHVPDIRLQAAGGVTGTILSSASDRPVNGVVVRLLDLSKPESQARATACAGTSDYTGQFRVPSVPRGYYRAEFEHPAYLPMSIDDIAVIREKSTDLGRLFIDAGGAVQGSVRDQNGNPVAGVAISVSNCYPQRRTSTDAGGYFLLQGVRPGNWPIVARGSVNNRQVYAFHSVSVQAQETRMAEFLLETSAYANGMIAAADAPVQSGNVRIHPFDENANVLEDIFYDATVRTARFAIDAVPPGQYFLWANGYANTTPYKVWQNLFLSRGMNDVTVTLSPSALHGRVADAEGKPVSGTSLQLLPLFDRLRLPRSLYNSLIRPGFSDPDGLFRFEHLQAGGYQLIYADPMGILSGQWIALPPLQMLDGQSIENYGIQSGK